MKKILFISSSYTGYGHKSITQAISENLFLYDDVAIEVVEGYALMGGIVGVKTSALYGPITRRASELWKMAYDVTAHNQTTLNDITEAAVAERFLYELSLFKPDIIVSVHAQFNGSLISVLEKYNLNIPLCTVIADLVDIHPVWWDNRAAVIFCPTDESASLAKKSGIDDDRIFRCGFPIRKQFTELAAKREHRPYESTRPVECLIMSGGEGSGNLKYIARILLNRFHTNVTVICGRNNAMREMLSYKLRKYGKRARILGFCNNIEEYMFNADICFLRGSPNSIMEGIMCNTPLVITGALPGQEAHNPEYIEKHGLGVSCPDLQYLPDLMEELFKDDGVMLREISKNQREFRNINCAKEIADKIYSITEHRDRLVNYKPSLKHKISRGIRKIGIIAKPDSME